MNADRWIFPLALCFICVSSNDDQHYKKSCGELCKTQKLMAPLGSSVLLPCSFTNTGFNVSWARTPTVDFVHLLVQGRVKFLDPKSGRVKAFLNQGSKGNYSICIDELEESDLGCYRCNQGNACLQVELSARSETLSNELWLLIYIGIVVAAFILLSVCSYFVYTKRNKSNPNNPAGVVSIEGVTAGPSAPPQDTIRPPVQELQQGAYNSNLVYENDDQGPTNHWGSNAPQALHDVARTQPTQNPSGLYPNLNQFNFQRVASERTKLKFHTELMNRLRQASFSRHYYVNQRELRKQQAMSNQAENHPRGAGKNKAKENFEYKNPIYNRSTEQLNRR